MANIITAGNSTNGGTAITTDTSGTLNIVTGSGSGTTAITVDGSQNLLIGTTTATSGSRCYVKSGGNTSSTINFITQNSSGTNLLYVRDDGLIVTGSAAASPYNNTTASASNVVVDSNGTLYRSTSSLKYKKNVKNSVHGLADILKLRSVTYEGKSETDAGKIFGGLIAEEVHEIGLTEFVQYAEDGTPDALNYGNMISLCVKAIQELKAELDAVKAKVGA